MKPAKKQVAPLLALMMLILSAAFLPIPARAETTNQTPAEQMRQDRLIGANQGVFPDFLIYGNMNEINETFRTAAENGINVIRVFLDFRIENTNESWTGVQFVNGTATQYYDAPGYNKTHPWPFISYVNSYNKNLTFRMMFWDKVLNMAARNNVRLLIILSDFDSIGVSSAYYWYNNQYYCSYDSQWFYFSNPSCYYKERPYADITNMSAVKAYENYIHFLLTRKNTVNGRVWANDSTVYAWDIANEPIPGLLNQTCSQFGNWVETISGYVKQLDPTHPITIGLGSGDFNTPGFANDWSTLASGCISSSQARYLDFLSLHYYASFDEQNKEWPSLPGMVHELLALGKPVVVEEFGIILTSQSENLTEAALGPSYPLAYKAYFDKAFCAGASAVLFWGWAPPEVWTWRYLYYAEWYFNSTDTSFVGMIKNYTFPFQLGVASPYGVVTGTGCYPEGSVHSFSLGDTLVNTAYATRELFVGWNGTGPGSYTGSNQNASVKMNGQINETADWLRQYALTVSTSLGGTTTSSPSGQWFNEGTNVTLTAKPTQGQVFSYKFKGWYENSKLVSNSTTYTLEMSGPVDIDAEFVPLAVVTHTATSVSVTLTTTTTPATTAASATTSGSGGVPEFPYQLAAAATFTVLLVASYFLVRRAKSPQLRAAPTS